MTKPLTTAVSVAGKRLNRSLSSLTPLPPPEWIQPFTDLSGVTKPQPQPSPWIPKILDFLHSNNSSNPNLEHTLTQFCHKYLIRLPPNFVSHVLQKTGGFPYRAETAFRFFTWAGKQTGYVHSLESYVSIIEILCTENDSTRVKSVFNELKCKGFLMNAISANSLIKSFGNGGMVEELLWVWRKMKDDGIEPSLYTYNFLMNGLVNCMLIELCEKVFDIIANGKVNVNPDVVTYNTMIKGYCKAGNVKKAIGTWKEMEGRGVEADKITFLTLIQACYNEGEYDFCLRVYNEMVEKGVEVPLHAYSLVIGGLCRAGKVMEGYAVFESMVGRGCEGNVVIYTALIDGYVKNGNLDLAMGLFWRMGNEGFEADVVTYGVIVNGLCGKGRVKEAMEWFEYCKGEKVPINGVVYTSLIDGLGKAGRIDEAEKLFEEMGEIGCPRDSYCYNVMMNVLVKNGRVEKALEVFKRMGDEGCDQTVYTFTILIDGLFKEHRNEEALKMWDLMIDKGITPTEASFRALSTGLCLSGKVARACKILDELAPMGVFLDTAFEDMVNVLCKAGRVVDACKLADGIVERGREVPGRVRTVMINALRKAGNADLAMKLMHSKIGIGYDRVRHVKKPVKFRNLVES